MNIIFPSLTFLSTTILILSIVFLLYSGYKFGHWLKHKIFKIDN